MERVRSLDMIIRLVIALAVGAAAAILAPLPDQTATIVRVLLGFIAGALVLDLPLLWMVVSMGASDTERYARRIAPTKRIIDVVVIMAAVASLAAVATMLAGGGDKDQTQRDLEAFLTVAAVGCAWLSVHTSYTFRYARHYFVSEPGSVDFNSTTDPRLSDFAYLAFTLGMTYQVSDTDIKTPRLRRVVLAHTVLSYLFGTVIIAATINLVAGLAK